MNLKRVTKRIIISAVSIFCAAAITITYLPHIAFSEAAAATTAASGSTAVTTTSSVNLRSGAGSTNKIVVTLNKGVSLKVIDNSDNVWLKVQTSDGKQGYCSKQYLQIGAAASTTPPASPTTAVSNANATAVTTDYINLREGAGASYKAVTTISKGSTLKVLDNSNAQWTKVQASNGKQGYCS